MKASADNTEIVFLRPHDAEHPLVTMFLCNMGHPRFEEVRATTEGTSVGRTLQFYLSRLQHNNGASYALHAGACYELWRRSNER